MEKVDQVTPIFFTRVENSYFWGASKKFNMIETQSWKERLETGSGIWSGEVI
jgi:hypothetical protein